MKLTTAIAAIIVATDPVLMPIADRIDQFFKDVDIEVADLRAKKNRKLFDAARKRAMDAGAPQNEVMRAESDGIHALDDLAARWKRLRATVETIKTAPYQYESL